MSTCEQHNVPDAGEVIQHIEVYDLLGSREEVGDNLTSEGSEIQRRKRLYNSGGRWESLGGSAI